MKTGVCRKQACFTSSSKLSLTCYSPPTRSRVCFVLLRQQQQGEGPERGAREREREGQAEAAVWLNHAALALFFCLRRFTHVCLSFLSSHERTRRALLESATNKIAVSLSAPPAAAAAAAASWSARPPCKLCWVR